MAGALPASERAKRRAATSVVPKAYPLINCRLDARRAIRLSFEDFQVIEH